MAPKRSYRKWSDETMAEALATVRRGLILEKASKQFGVPKQTYQIR